VRGGKGEGTRRIATYRRRGEGLETKDNCSEERKHDVFIRIRKSEKEKFNEKERNRVQKEAHSLRRATGGKNEGTVSTQKEAANLCR